MTAQTATTIREMAEKKIAEGNYTLAMFMLRPIQAEDDQAKASFALAHLLSGDAASAADLYQDLTARYPNFLDGWVNLAQALKKLGRADAAQEALATAQTLAPDHPEIHYNQGNLLLSRERDREAEAAYQAVLREKPDHLGAGLNLGEALKNQGKLAEAETVWRTGLQRFPDQADLSLALSFLLLEQQRFEEGWRLFEARRRIPALQPRRFDIPEWTGDRAGLAGQRVLLHAEQGLGDMIMLARYLPALIEAGAEIELLCPAPLVPLLSRFGDDITASNRTGPTRRADLQIPAFSLPHLFHTGPDNWFSQTLLPPPDPERVAEIRAALPAAAPVIGFAHCGNPSHANDHHRSIPAELLTLLTDQTDATWVWLGTGDAPPAQMLDMRDRLTDLSAAADLVAALDLVISVDTVWAHLAGALGKPVWIALPARGRDWRWFGTAETSPWYPTATLVHQPAPGCWESVLVELQRRVRAFTLETPPVSG